MRSIGKIGAIWILFMIAVSCARYDQVAKIQDISRKQTIVLKNISGKKSPHSINIRISGKIDGEAKIFLMLDDKPYKTENIENSFKITWGGDWYSDTAEIRYEPINVKKGELVIEYRFVTIN